MAKVYFGKLDLNKPSEVKTFDWQGQTIEVKQYLPLAEKMELVNKIMADASSESRMYHPYRIREFSVINLFFAYTNVSITDKQAEDSGKLYDMLVNSGIYSRMLDNLPIIEYNEIMGVVGTLVEKVDKYTNSIYGIMDSLGTDYEGLKADAQTLLSNLSESKDIELVSDVMNKLG